MMCFRDRTYCNSKNCNNECGRQLTQEVWDSAEKSGLPVAYSYFCGEPERDE